MKLFKIRNFFWKALDVLGGGIIYAAGGVLAFLAVVGGAAAVAVSVIMSCAVPAMAIVIIWGVLKYFGVL